MVIKNHKHSFSIMGHDVELLINFTNGLWKAEVIKGNTGVGTCSGGSAKTLDEYIGKIEQEHKYAYYFYGSSGNNTYAKQMAK